MGHYNVVTQDARKLGGHEDLFARDAGFADRLADVFLIRCATTDMSIGTSVLGLEDLPYPKAYRHSKVNKDMCRREHYITYSVQMAIAVLLPFVRISSHVQRIMIPTFRAFLTISSTVSPPPGEPIQHLHDDQSLQRASGMNGAHPMPIDGIFWPLLKVKYGMVAAMIAISWGMERVQR